MSSVRVRGMLTLVAFVMIMLGSAMVWGIHGLGYAILAIAALTLTSLTFTFFLRYLGGDKNG